MRLLVYSGRDLAVEFLGEEAALNNLFPPYLSADVCNVFAFLGPSIAAIFF